MGCELRVEGLEFRFQDSWFRVQGSRFRVESSGLMVRDVRVSAPGSGLRVNGADRTAEHSGRAVSSAWEVTRFGVPESFAEPFPSWPCKKIEFTMIYRNKTSGRLTRGGGGLYCGKGVQALPLSCDRSMECMQVWNAYLHLEVFAVLEKACPMEVQGASTQKATRETFEPGIDPFLRFLKRSRYPGYLG